MRVRVKLAGHLRRYGREEAEEFVQELAAGGTVQDLINQLQVPDSSFAFCAVNGARVPLSRVLSEGDTVVVYPPIGGG